jgi:DNA-binding NarL/FixJ family response regulator
MSETPATQQQPVILISSREPILRLGLSRWLEEQNLAQVVTSDQPGDLQNLLSERLQQTQPLVNLLVVDLEAADIPLCQSLRRRYPHLPILALGPPVSRDRLLQFQELGLAAYVERHTPAMTLWQWMQAILSGYSPWLQPETLTPRWRSQLYSQGLAQIEAALAQCQQWAQRPRPWLEMQITRGRIRELQAARRLLTWLWRPGPVLAPPPAVTQPPPALPSGERLSRVRQKFNQPLTNNSGLLLETDLLRFEKQRELWNTVLNRWEALLAELTAAQITPEELTTRCPELVERLWQEALTDFVGRYYTVDGRNVLEVLLAQRDTVRAAILDKIPLVNDLFSFHLFQTPLPIDGVLYAANSQIASDHAAILLENLVIQVANGVVQPLLNCFPHHESVKQRFYRRNLLSTRETERLRNQLSQRYRWQRYWDEPRAIFESRYQLLRIQDQAIVSYPVYAGRTAELAQLRGIPWLVTLWLEFQDAIAPVLRAVANYIGRTSAYLLTRIIGRGLGLIGRGILQGIGSTWQNNRSQESSQL